MYAVALAEENDNVQGKRSKQKEAKVEVVKRGISKAELIAEAGAITPLVSLLNGRRGPEAQEEAAGALTALADQERNRVAITEAGGIGPLVMLLGCQNAKAREHAELALVRLSIEGANRVIIIEQLVAMLHDERGTAAQEQAAAALANLARESADNRTSIVKADGIPRLLHLLHSTSSKAKENSASAISQLAHKSIENQTAIANANGIPKLVSALISASANVKETAGIKLCTYVAECIWHMADGNKENQTSLMKEGAIPPIVTMVTNPDPGMQTNAAGALACLSKDHPDNQAAVARSGAIPPLCTMVRDGTTETKEQSAAAIWALATDNAANKATIAKLGGIEPLVSMLMYAGTENSSANAAGALAALAAQHADNRLIITKRMVTVLGGKAAPGRAVRLLSALASLCDNEPTNQVAIAKSGGVQHLIGWLGNTVEEVQVQAARAMLSVCSNNSTTQSLVGKLGGIPPLVELIKRSNLEAQENAACALWHLATLKENRTLIKEANGIPPVVGMLICEGKLAPQLASMLLVRIAEGSTRAALAIAEASGIAPLVHLLATGTSATQQMAGAALAAIARISRCRDTIANAGAINALITLISSETLGTPETSARVLAHLAKNDEIEDDVSDIDSDEQGTAPREGNVGETAGDADGSKMASDPDAGNGADGDSDDETEAMQIVGGEGRRLCIKDAGGVRQLVKMLNGSNLAIHHKTPLKPATVGGWAAVRVGVAGAVETTPIFVGSQVDFGMRIGMQEQAAATLAHLAADDLDLQDSIIQAEGVMPLLSLAQFGSPLAQEYAAQCIWYLATSVENQHTLVRHGCIVDLVNLVKSGSPVAQEMAAAALGQLAHGYIVEMGEVISRKPPASTPPPAHSDTLPSASREVSGTPLTSETPSSEDHLTTTNAPSPMAGAPAGAPAEAPSEAPAMASAEEDSASRAQLAEHVGPAEGRIEVQVEALENSVALAAAGASAGAAVGPVEDLPAGAGSFDPVKASEGGLASKQNDATEGAEQDGASERRRLVETQTLERAITPEDVPDEYDRLGAISRADGVPALIKLAEAGAIGGKEKAAAALWHLALDPDVQEAIASNGGIKPLVSLLADGSEAAQIHASKALSRLAKENEENQAQIAKRLVGLLDHDDAMVVSRAAHDLQSLAQDHPGAPAVIVSAGAISPLVTVLSNGKTDEGRNEAARTLATLANSGPANQLAIAVGLVALLGVGTDQAQEYVTALLLDLTSGSGNLHNRKAIANAGPFKMLVQQLRSDSAKVKFLAAAVMAKLSGDSEENVQAIAQSKGIPPLVSLLAVDDPETQAHAAVVLSDMTRRDQAHAAAVASEGGIPLLVALLTSGHGLNAKAEAAGALGSVAEVKPHEVGGAGAVIPLVGMLKTDSRFAQASAARAIARIAAGGKVSQDSVATTGGIEFLVPLLSHTSAPEVEEKLESESVATWQVQAAVAEAIGKLAHSNSAIQTTIAKCGGLEQLIALVKGGHQDEAKEQAAFALWQLSASCRANQVQIAEARGISELVAMVGSTSDRGQLMAAEALASLALDNVENKGKIAALLTKLLEASGGEGDEREKAARAISRFAHAHFSNQDAIATAGGLKLIVALLDPQHWEPPKPGEKSKKGAKEEEEGMPAEEEVEASAAGEHHRTQNELAAALWSLSIDNPSNQKAIAEESGLPKLIALIDDRPEIHRNAAGALWSLAADSENQRLIADAGGIPQLVELLNSGRKLGTLVGAEETAAGALRSLALRPENRDLIAEAGGISLLVPLFDGGSELAKTEVTGALLALVVDNPSNQFTIASKLVSMLAAAPDASEASNVAAFARVEASEHAANVVFQLTLDRDNKDALQKTPVILNLVRLLKGGSDKAQKLSADALIQIARMSAELRIQVSQQLVTLLSMTNADVRERASRVLHDMNDTTAEDLKSQREAAMAGGVAPLVELFKDGLKNQRIEAQEYALWSLSMTADQKRGALMVREGCIQPLIESLDSGNLSLAAQENAAIVLSCLALDRTCHEEILDKGGIMPLVQLLTAETVGAKMHSATALARLALGNPETQARIAQAGALKPLVQWLVASSTTGKEEKRKKPSASPDSSPTGTGLAKPDAKSATSSGEARRRASRDEVPRRVSREEETRKLSTEERSPTSSPRKGRASHESDLSTRRLSSEDLKVAPLQPVPRELAPVAALALADLARDNIELQTLISEAGALKPLIVMLTDFSDADAQKAACSALATLAQGSTDNQVAISTSGGIPPLAELIKSNRIGSHENATRALAMLAVDDDNKAEIAKTGGIEPLVGLLTTGNELTKQHAAKALESLAHDCPENQVALANCRAYIPLVELLRSDSDATADSAVAALLCLAEHASSQKPVIKRLVDVLNGKSTSAQLKSAQALAALSRNVNHRTVLSKACAIEPLVSLLGNGSRSDKNTPPERAAAVIAELSRIADCKVEIARAGGILPLVVMLSSKCEDAQQHASCAVFHLSLIADNKVGIASSGGITRLVALLKAGTIDTVRYSAGALWQLANSADNKNAIAAAGGIPALVNVLLTADAETGAEPVSAPTPRRRGSSNAESTVTLAKETASAVLAELARSQSSFRIEIVRSGGVGPLIELMKGEAPGAQKQATCALWGLTSEPKYRQKVGNVPGAIERLVELLRHDEGETQGYAAAALVNLAHDERAKQEITTVGGAGPLMTIGLGHDSWLRQQCVQCLKLMGYPDPREKTAKNVGSPHSPRLAKFQAQLAANPDLWMMTEPEQKAQPIINEEHMADIAAKFKVGNRVIVDPGERLGEIKYIGKIEEIAPGYWIGVMYDDPVGKNDGSIKGTRCFECAHDHGGFLRPDHIRIDPDPPPPRVKRDAGAPAAEGITPTEEEAKIARRKKKTGSAVEPNVEADAPAPAEAPPIPLPEPYIAQGAPPTKKANAMRPGRKAPLSSSPEARREKILSATQSERSTGMPTMAASDMEASDSTNSRAVDSPNEPALQTANAAVSARRPPSKVGMRKLPSTPKASSVRSGSKASPRQTSPRLGSPRQASPRQTSPRGTAGGALTARQMVAMALPSERSGAGKGAKSARAGPTKRAP